MLEIAKLCGVLERLLLQFDREPFMMHTPPRDAYSILAGIHPVVALSSGQMVTYDRLSPLPSRYRRSATTREILGGGLL
jgi:hypothetical protein